MLQTDSKIYSVSVNLNDDDPNIKVRELTTSFDIPGLASANCDGLFFFYEKVKGSTVWNPCLRQSRLTELEPFYICGMGYDSSRPVKSYKIVGIAPYFNHLRFCIYDFATNAWKFVDDDQCEGKSTLQQSPFSNNVSLNGNLYWTAYNVDSRQCFIRVLNYSKEILKPFCVLPCTNSKKDSSHSHVAHVLAVFKGDRFSLLEQCDITRKIEIWVTKKKVNNGDDGDDVVWIKFISVLKPNFPWLINKSYFLDNNIYEKCLAMCCRDEKTRQACVYIVRRDKWRVIKIDDVVGELQRCSVYVPSLIPIP